jgi:hypothetical protein
VFVNGSINIDSNGALTTVSLPALANISGSIIIASNSVMKKLFLKKDIRLMSFFDVPAQEMKVVRNVPKWYQMVYEDVK